MPSRTLLVLATVLCLSACAVTHVDAQHRRSLRSANGGVRALIMSRLRSSSVFAELGEEISEAATETPTEKVMMLVNTALININSEINETAKERASFMGRFSKRETTLRATMAANKLMIEKNFKCHQSKIEEAKNAEIKAEDLREAKHSDAHFQNISATIKKVMKERRAKATAYNHTKQSFKRQHKHHSFLRDTIDAIHHLINKHVTKQRQEETAKTLAAMSSGSSGSSGASGASGATGVEESGEVTVGNEEDDIVEKKGGKKNKGGQDQQSLEAPAAAEEPAVLLELEAFAQREGLFLGGEGDREHSQEAAERSLKAAEEAVEEGNTADPTRELRTVTGETVAVRVQDALKLLSERLDNELGALRDAHDVASAVHEKELNEMNEKLSKLHAQLKFDQHENEVHEIAAKKADEVADAARKAAQTCVAQTPKLKEQCARLGKNINATYDEKEKLHHAYEMVMKELLAEKRLGEWILNLIESKLHKLRKDTQIAKAVEDAKEKAAVAGIVAKKMVNFGEDNGEMSDSASETGVSPSAEEAAEKALGGLTGGTSGSGSSGASGASGGTGPEEVAVGLQASAHFKSAAQEALAQAKKAAEHDIDSEANKMTQDVVKAPLPSVAEVEKCATSDASYWCKDEATMALCKVSKELCASYAKA